MKVYVLHSCIDDLKESNDGNFFKQVLNHTIDKEGQFKVDANDHRYEGIKDGWIRYVSRGKTAYRVIYIRKNDDIYLYRAGRHSIEERLKAPSDLDTNISFDTSDVYAPLEGQDMDRGNILKTVEDTYLSRVLTSMYHVGHRSITIISPFISFDIIGPRHHFGRFLDRAIEENTEVTLITRPPSSDNVIRQYKQLEERCIFVYFNDKLHTKLYMFEINPKTLSRYNKEYKKTAILGSANLTENGIGFDVS
jgi:hypothetical protein